MPSGAFSPVVIVAFGGTIGSAVIASPWWTMSGEPLAVVQFSIFVVGLAFDCAQYTLTPSMYTRFGAFSLRMKVVNGETTELPLRKLSFSSPPSPVGLFGPAGIV